MLSRIWSQQVVIPCRADRSVLNRTVFIIIGGGELDQALIKELFEKINAITLSLATLTAKSEAKENRCEDHQKKMEDHDLRIRALELVASSAAGSNQTSHNWRDTLIQAFTMAATVAAAVIAMRLA